VLPDFPQRIAFCRFPGFVRFSFRYEEYVDENEYVALVE
jgi:hypothetical protein